jgi:hypothetical protein
VIHQDEIHIIGGEEIQRVIGSGCAQHLIPSKVENRDAKVQRNLFVVNAEEQAEPLRIQSAGRVAQALADYRCLA